MDITRIATVDAQRFRQAKVHFVRLAYARRAVRNERLSSISTMHRLAEVR